MTGENALYEELVWERDTKRMSFYGAPFNSPSFGNGIYLNTIALRQRFGGQIPSKIGVTVERRDHLHDD